MEYVDIFTDIGRSKVKKLPRGGGEIPEKLPQKKLTSINEISSLFRSSCRRFPSRGNALGPGGSFTFLLELKLEEEMKRISISTIRTITKKTEFVDSIKTASIVPMALKENIQNVLFELKETIFFLRMFQNL